MNIRESYKQVIDSTHERIVKLIRDTDRLLTETNRARRGSGEPQVPLFSYNPEGFGFISGNLYDPKNLIISINPGGGEVIYERDDDTPPPNVSGGEIIYYEQYHQKPPVRFAKALVDLIFDKNSESMRDTSAEIYALSPFASTKASGVEGTLNALKALDQGLWGEHDLIRKKLLQML